MPDLVSVVVAAYNTAKYLPEAIESVLNQTYKDFELIIVNDGSTDNTSEILQKYQNIDSRIVILNQKNTGFPLALNNGIALAKGTFLARFDSDDIMLPTRLEEQVKFLKENNEVTMTSCHAYYMNEKGGNTGAIQVFKGFQSIEDNKKVLENNEIVICVHTGFMTYLKSIVAVGSYRDIKPGEDIDLFTRMVENGEKLVIMQKALVKYRMHSSSMMATQTLKSYIGISWVRENTARRRKGEPEITIEEFVDNFKSKSWLFRWNFRRVQLANFYYRNMLIYFGEKKYLFAVYCYFVAIILRPFTMIGRISNQVFRKILNIKEV